MYQFHHTGLLVQDIDSTIEFYKKTLGFTEVSEVYNIANQKVKVCFIKNGTDSYLELVMPNPENKALYDMLKKKINYYHIGYLVNDFDLALEKIGQDTILLSTFHSEAFGGKRCSFVYTRELHLIELIEK